MNKKLKGFSLAELLISLLIISIVLSAAIPTITRKSGASREHIWRWSSANNDAYFGTGANQAAILGASKSPYLQENNGGLQLNRSISQIFGVSEIEGEESVNLNNVVFSNIGDKLIILKGSFWDENNKGHDLANSHISFFTIDNNPSSEATTRDIHYAGRIALNRHNMAFGIGSLQSLITDTRDQINPNWTGGNNTALGHYALTANTTGEKNIAVGEKALSFNQIGNNNTSVGFHSLFNLGNSTEENPESYNYSGNTSIGTESLFQIKSGSENTAAGVYALYATGWGSGNSGIGARALANASGNFNTGLGFEACSLLQNGNNNICIGSKSGNAKRGSNYTFNDSYALYIGSSIEAAQSEITEVGSQSGKDTALIEGHTQKVKITDSNNKKVKYDKELILNARHFKVNAYDGFGPLYQIEAIAGSDDKTTGGDGYGQDVSNVGYLTKQFIRVRKNQTMTNTFEIRPSTLEENGETNKTILIQTYDEEAKANNIGDYLNNLSFNNQLKFRFPQFPLKDPVRIYTTPNEFNQEAMLELNDRLTIGGFEKDADETNNPKMLINKDGIMMSLAEDNMLTFNQYGLTSTAEYIHLRHPSDITTNRISINTETGNMTIDTDAGDINIKQLQSSDSGKTGVSENIFALWKEIKKLKEEIQALKSSTPSDERLKNISGDNTSGLKEINQLQIKNFTYKDDKEKVPHVGVIAQQLQKIFPNSVIKDDKGYLRIRTEEIFYAMVNSIKELCTQIQNITAKITGLDKRITELEKQNKILLKQNQEFEKRLSKLEKQTN